MIGSSKNTGEIIPENAFEQKKKKPGLSANRPSNNRVQSFCWNIPSVQLRAMRWILTVSLTLAFVGDHFS